MLTALLALEAAVALSLPSAPVQVFQIADPEIAESSGLAVSPTRPGVIWTHNDSGDSARVFALGPKGQTLGVWALDVGEPRDWEAMTATTDESGRGVLWVGDIGDNNSARDNGVLVHRVLEPEDPEGGGTLEATSYRLRYADGPHDAEAMFFGADGRLRIVTKELFGGSVFVAPDRLNAAGTTVLQREGDAPGIVTDATALPEGRYALRDYSAAFVYDESGELLARVPLPSSPQGESLSASANGLALLAGSEGEGSVVWRVPLPQSVRPAPTPSPGAAAAGSQLPAAPLPASESPGWRLTWPVAALGLGAVLVLGYGALRGRRGG